MTVNCLPNSSQCLCIVILLSFSAKKLKPLVYWHAVFKNNYIQNITNEEEHFSNSATYAVLKTLQLWNIIIVRLNIHDKSNLPILLSFSTMRHNSNWYTSVFLLILCMRALWTTSKSSVVFWQLTKLSAN